MNEDIFSLQALCYGAWIGFISIAATWGYVWACLEGASILTKIMISMILSILILCVGLKGFIL